MPHLRRDKDVRELAPGGQAEPGAVEEGAEDDHGASLHDTGGLRSMNLIDLVEQAHAVVRVWDGDWLVDVVPVRYPEMPAPLSEPVVVRGSAREARK